MFKVLSKRHNNQHDDTRHYDNWHNNKLHPQVQRNFA
jgi:hypothetical protein